MTEPRAAIGFERRRQIQVRKAFEAGLGRAGKRLPDFERAEFYLACGDYLVWSLDRLHDQDQLIHDLLGERLPEREREALKALATLRRRQGESRALVGRFRAAVERLRREGRRGLKVFEAAAKRFTRQFRELMAPRRNPFEPHTDHLFDRADWLAIAWVDPGSQDTERTLFAAVSIYAPDGTDPEQFTAEHQSR